MWPFLKKLKVFIMCSLDCISCTVYILLTYIYSDMAESFESCNKSPMGDIPVVLTNLSDIFAFSTLTLLV